MLIEMRDGKTILIDYVRPQKSFADIEYEKWLKERDAKKENQNDRQAKISTQTD